MRGLLPDWWYLHVATRCMTVLSSDRKPYFPTSEGLCGFTMCGSWTHDVTLMGCFAPHWIPRLGILAFMVCADVEPIRQGTLTEWAEYDHIMRYESAWKVRTCAHCCKLSYYIIPLHDGFYYTHVRHHCRWKDGTLNSELINHFLFHRFIEFLKTIMALHHITPYCTCRGKNECKQYDHRPIQRHIATPCNNVPAPGTPPGGGRGWDDLKGWNLRNIRIYVYIYILYIYINMVYYGVLVLVRMIIN